MATYDPLTPGTLVNDRYEIEILLGAGGIGRTYRVKDCQKFGDLYTLKEFAPRIASYKTETIVKAKELFEREAKILNQLNHPQIPKFHGYFSEDDRIFLVQDYIQGVGAFHLGDEYKYSFDLG